MRTSFKVKAYAKLVLTMLLAYPVYGVLGTIRFAHRKTSNAKVAKFIKDKMIDPLESSVIMNRFVDWGLREVNELQNSRR